MCPVCSNNVEDHFHVFKDCSGVKNLRINLQAFGDLSLFENMKWKEWPMFNLNKLDAFNGVPWPIIFGVTLDNLWLRRNELVFQQTNMSGRHLYHRVMTMAHNIVSSHKSATTAANSK